LTSSELLIIGVGNPLMGDDGIGVAVAERLAGEDLPAGVRVVEAGVIGLALLDLWENVARVWLVDAVRMGLEPGSCRWLDKGAIGDMEGDALDAHAGLTATLQLAMALERLPRDFRLLGVEPAAVERRMGISEAGRRGLETALRELRQAIAAG